MRSTIAFVALLAVASACGSGKPRTARTGGAAREESLVAAQVPAVGWDAATPSLAGPLPAPPQPMAVGAIVAGTLATGDMPVPGGQGGVCDHYLLQLRAGEPITIVARGGMSFDAAGRSMDMYIYLYFDRVEVAHDDDSASAGGSFNSRIVYTPERTGTYVLRVTTFGGSLQQGTYTIQTYPGALPDQV